MYDLYGMYYMIIWYDVFCIFLYLQHHQLGLDTITPSSNLHEAKVFISSEPISSESIDDLIEEDFRNMAMPHEPHLEGGSGAKIRSQDCETHGENTWTYGKKHERMRQ